MGGGKAIDVKIQYISETVNTPKYATGGSLGLDLSAAVHETVVITPGKIVLIGTGVSVQIPQGFGGFVFARSGLSSRSGITLVNGVGVIDSDYTGEIKIPLINVSDQDYSIEPGDRIAQMVFLPVAIANLVHVDFVNTDRGDNGFGSSGK